MEKTHVNGPSADPVWRMAKSAFPGDIGWNFHGIFLFDAEGAPKGRFDANQLSAVGQLLEKLVLEAKQEL